MNARLVTILQNYARKPSVAVAVIFVCALAPRLAYIAVVDRDLHSDEKRYLGSAFMLWHHGRYGKWELFSEETYQSILPTLLTPYFPDVTMEYGIGLQNAEVHLGPGSYGHGGGCGTQLIVNPEKHLVFAMVRNGRGKDYKKHLADVSALLKSWIHD